MKTPLAVLVFAMLLAPAAESQSSALAQSSAWTSYLHGAARDELDQAVQAVEAEWASATREFDALYDGIEERYVLARSETLDSGEYARLLDEVLPEPDAEPPAASPSTSRTSSSGCSGRGCPATPC